MTQDRFHVVHPKAYIRVRVKFAEPLQPPVVMASVLLPILFLVQLTDDKTGQPTAELYLFPENVSAFIEPKPLVVG